MLKTKYPFPSRTVNIWGEDITIGIIRISETDREKIEAWEKVTGTKWSH